MIVSKNIHPENSLYCIGAIIVEAINALEGRTSFSVLFQMMNVYRELSVEMYSLALSWLFALGIVDRSEAGEIFGCH